MLVLVVITVMPYGTVEVWSTAIWEVLILLITLLWGIHTVINKRLNIELNPLVWPMVAIVAIACVQLIPMMSGTRRTITYDSYATTEAALKWFVHILFFLLFATFVNSPERRKQAVTTIVILSVIIALIGIGQTYGKLIWPRAAFGPFVNRNHFAGFLEMAAGLIGARIISGTLKRERMVLYICYLIIVCSGLILSASRGGYLSLAAVILFLALVSLTTRSEKSNASEDGRGLQLRMAAALILLVVMSFGAMFLTNSDDLLQRFKQVEENISVGELADERYNRREVWQTTMQMVKDHPLLGVGLGAYPFAYPHYDQGSGLFRTEQSHNDYLQILADTGIIGGLLMLAFLALLFVRSFKVMQTRDLVQRSIVLGALAGCFGIAVHSFVEFNLQVTNNAQLFLALAALATTKPAMVKEPPIQTESKEMAYSFR